MRPFDRLHEALQHHVVNTLGWAALRPLQEQAIDPILDGEDALLVAPTAGGKTEAAVLPVFSRMLAEGWRGLTVIYVCPIKALLNNLHGRLSHLAGLVGRRVELWHGDVGASRRKKLLADPPDVLLTTPESLEVILISPKSQRTGFLSGLRVVVVDEIHAFAADDRGWHLGVVLERIVRASGRPVQRLGLSATVGNPEFLAQWLAGPGHRPARVVNGEPAVPAATAPDVCLDYVGSLENAATVLGQLYRGEKRLVFCDSRARVEQLAAALRGAGVETFVSHSSLSLSERRRSEEAFASRSDCIIVATSTLELGLDVGDLDRVVQIDAPRAVSSFLQRMGRTGRRTGSGRNCLVLTTTPGELTYAAGLLRLWREQGPEPIVPPPLPLHVVTQQLMTLSLQEARAGRNLWHEWIGDFCAAAGITAAQVEELLAHLLAEGWLTEDQGLLSIGPTAERKFGGRHYSELCSVFAADALVDVYHGQDDLGRVHPITFTRSRKDQPVVLLLGGRSWEVTRVDWPARRAHVVPSNAEGRSRWMGTSRPASWAHCQAIRAALLGADVPATLTRRAQDALATTREDFRWASPDATTVVTATDGRAAWWTWAGMRANAMLRTLIGPCAEPDARLDNLAIELAPGVGLEGLEGMLGAGGRQEVGPCLVSVNEEAIEGLKFSECMPRAAATNVVRLRGADIQAVAWCLGQRRAWTNGSTTGEDGTYSGSRA